MPRHPPLPHPLWRIRRIRRRIIRSSRVQDLELNGRITFHKGAFCRSFGLVITGDIDFPCSDVQTGYHALEHL